MQEENSKNKFQETTSRDGFFKSYYNNFKECFTPDLFDAFAKLKSDVDRVRMIATYLPVCREVKPEPNCGKDNAFANELKDKGNSYFVKGDTSEALEAYTKAALKISFVKESSTECAIILANRSAALYHLEKFVEAIQDIDISLDLGYPKDLRFKILERKSKCLLALKRHAEALTSFRCTLQSLDDCKLPVERKIKMQKDIQCMLNLLTKPITKHGHVNAFVEGQKLDGKEESSQIIKVTGRKNLQFPSLNEKVEILEGDIVGRYAAAKTLINPGEIVAVEKAYCSVLLMEYAHNHCQYCFKRTTCPYPCSGCSVAVYCSPSCKDAAQDSFHKFECKIANALYRSGASVTVLMALRMITQKKLQYFIELKKSLKQPHEERKIYKSQDYNSAYNLVCHEQQRQPHDFLERTVMTVFLLRCLQVVGYFGKEEEQQVKSLSEDEEFIGSLILRHLQLLQFNAHEIAELEMDCTESMDKAKSIFIGGGLFPTLALFNHSCDPAVVRYFVGTTVIVRTVRSVDKGELVAENYGPIFTIKEKEQRKKELKARYWFDCGCTPCSEDWPLISKMNRKIMRFRCNSGEGVNCQGSIEVPCDTSEFMPQCSTCGNHTNILKGLKALQETDIMFRQAVTDVNKGKFKAALDIYLEILRILHCHLKPPFYDYHVCQEAVRKCMLSLGNKYVI